MRHRVKKNKFKYGKDANKMVIIKLVNSFLKRGEITTTTKKIKLLRSQIDRLVNQAKKNKINYLMRKVNNRKLVNFLINKVIPVFNDRVSGYTTFKKVGVRLSDGSELAKLTWIKPIVISQKKVKEKNETKTNQTDQSTPKK